MTDKNKVVKISVENHRYYLSIVGELEDLIAQDLVELHLQDNGLRIKDQNYTRSVIEDRIDENTNKLEEVQAYLKGKFVSDERSA